MFGVSFFELVMIFGVALVVFGPDKLPEVARTIGKVMGELRRNTEQVKRELYTQLYAPPPPRREALPAAPEAKAADKDAGGEPQPQG